MSDKVKPEKKPTLVEILVGILQTISKCPYCPGCKQIALQGLEAARLIQAEEA